MLKTIRKNTIKINPKSKEKLDKQIQMTLGYTNECKKEKKINGERLKKRITNRNRQDTAADNRSKKTKQKSK